MNLPSLFRQYNTQHFAGQIPLIPVRWNSRLRTTAGACHYRRGWDGKAIPNHIALNPHILRGDPDKLRDTLLHEMTHALLTSKYGKRVGHNAEFHRVLSQALGRSSTRCHSYDIAHLQRWEICCKSCGRLGAFRSRRSSSLRRKVHAICGSDLYYRENREYSL
jgi:predicted SprT family Zn-dependent metalloprotease